MFLWLLRILCRWVESSLKHTKVWKTWKGLKTFRMHCIYHSSFLAIWNINCLCFQANTENKLTEIPVSMSVSLPQNSPPQRLSQSSLPALQPALDDLQPRESTAKVCVRQQGRVLFIFIIIREELLCRRLCNEPFLTFSVHVFEPWLWKWWCLSE